MIRNEADRKTQRGRVLEEQQTEKERHRDLETERQNVKKIQEVNGQIKLKTQTETVTDLKDEK